MKIRDVKVHRENLKLTRPYTIAYKSIDVVENGIITLTGDNGLTGYGAFSPVFEVTGEKLEDALHSFNDDDFTWLTGQSLSEVYSLNETITRLQGLYKTSPSARAGLEIALYDLFTQTVGIPLVDFFGQQIYEMPTAVTIGIKGVSETVAEAREYGSMGFRILKVKLGHSAEEDIERMTKLRETFGNGFRLIVDANQGYDVTALMQFCEQTAGLGIELIEQPLLRGCEETLRNLPDSIKALIAADESLIGPDDALSLSLSPKACGFFNIKLMKCGGVSEAIKIARTAAAHNIELLWGCNDESIISITAALNIAFTCKHTRYIDLDGSLDLAEDVVRGGFILKEGMMSLPARPGLGLLPF